MINSRLKNFFTYTIIVTTGTFLYVHQNIVILKLGYNINTSRKAVSYYLDERSNLMYNLNKLKSPHALDERLKAVNISLVEPDTRSIYYASGDNARLREITAISALKEYKAGMLEKLLDLFILKAEARTRKPQ